jgi:hypothetical protein
MYISVGEFIATLFGCIVATISITSVVAIYFYREDCKKKRPINWHDCDDDGPQML